MAIPKASTPRATATSATSAASILPTGTRSKLTLTMRDDLKRRLKTAAAAHETSISALVEEWAESWLSQRNGPTF